MQFRYGDGVSSGLRLGRGLLFGAIPTAISALAHRPALIVVGVIAFIAGLIPKTRYGKLVVTPRYVACETGVCYFAEVTSITIEAHGVTLHSNSHALPIRLDKFVSDSRKIDKINAKRHARLKQATELILGHVRLKNPAVVVTTLP